MRRVYHIEFGSSVAAPLAEDPLAFPWANIQGTGINFVGLLGELAEQAQHQQKALQQ